MDRIGRIIDAAIWLTADVETYAPEHIPAAVASLFKVRHRLARRHPDHPAIKKIDDYLAKFVTCH